MRSVDSDRTLTARARAAIERLATSDIADHPDALEARRVLTALTNHLEKR